MKTPVKLAILHEITDNDPVLERRMFQSFLQSAAECIATMEASWDKGMEYAWQRQAHALKGLCLNLGAEHLGHLCKKAQDSSTASPEDKLKLLKEIRSELGNVKWYLEKGLH